jgi:nickel/cobalt transporter (NicO) family protein
MKKIVVTIFLFSLLFFLLIYLQDIFDFSYWASFVELQKLGSKSLYEKFYALKNEISITTLFILFLISFFYGILHATGPGHGKVIVANFFITNNHSQNTVFKVSILSSLIHTGSAICLALLFRTIFTYINVFQRITIIDKFRIFSGTMILIIGFILLIKPLLFSKLKLINFTKNFKKCNVFLIALLAGIIPCPISMNIMLISLSMEMFYVGLTVVLGISLGMLVLLYIVGLSSLKASHKLLNVIQDEKNLSAAKFIKYAGLIQAIFFIIIGLFMIKIV